MAVARAGMLVVVVGPSGAGKDSLIAYARERLSEDPSVLFVRRAVTRAPDRSAEDHDGLSDTEFAATEHAGGFAVTWQAHGLRYGLPAAARRHVEAGGIAIANGSRAALPNIRERFGRVTVVHVTASADVLARRLAARGREDGTEIERRLSRAPAVFSLGEDVVEIDNSDDLTRAGEALLAAIRGEAG